MSKRLLIVDDSLFMRMVIKDLAREAGWEVVAEASNGEEAIPLYERYQPDLVTLDMVMPKMGGLETLKNIRSHHPNAKVVVVSALDQKETLVETIKSGAIDFIVKPFEKERIFNVLAKAVAE